VELNPVRAKMVEKPEEYRWSSYQEKTGFKEQQNVDRDACYLSLGDTQEQRVERYKQWVEIGVSEQEIKSIREALQCGHPTGSQLFTEAIEKKLDIRLSLNKPGRPRKQINKRGGIIL
jgi:putative transposase